MSDRQKHYVTVDGNEAAAYIAYAFTEIAAIYPIRIHRNSGNLSDHTVIPDGGKDGCLVGQGQEEHFR